MNDFVEATLAPSAASLTGKRSGGFQISPLADNIAICEATKDRHRWNNGTETEPALIVYLGCNKNEVPMWIEKLNNFYHCYWIEVRKPKHLKEFEAELKIRGMKRCSDMEEAGGWGDGEITREQWLRRFGNKSVSGGDK
ncbi:MAG: hypothetical protein AB4372_23840 [Xenococcus sp. (in: cyanobacteria)]